jgi:hypothetical protein
MKLAHDGGHLIQWTRVCPLPDETFHAERQMSYVAMMHYSDLVMVVVVVAAVSPVRCDP